MQCHDARTPFMEIPLPPTSALAASMASDQRGVTSAAAVCFPARDFLGALGALGALGYLQLQVGTP